METLIISGICFITVFLGVIYIAFSKDSKKNIFKQEIKKINNTITKTTFFKNIGVLILYLERQLIINKKRKIITPMIILIISLIMFCVSYLFIYLIFKIWTTALILSIPFFFLPSFCLKTILSKQKDKILSNFPTYIINLKNNVSNTGDIISAIKNTKVNGPLEIYIKEFTNSVQGGISVHESFEKLKQNIEIKKINSFISACQICYIKGGDFTGILDQFSSIITKDNIQREKLKENSYSSIIALIVMFAINIYLIFAFVFKNIEYANIIRNTFGGVAILNFTAITYIVIGYLILKIYRMEE